jgi:O-antigen/teichoic acid export membrane protein
MVGVGAMLGYSSADLFYLLIICYSHSIAQLIAFFRAGFQSFQQFRIDAFASILDRLILIGIVAVLLSRNISLDSFVFAAFISLAISMVVLYVVLVKKVFPLVPGKADGSWAAMLKLSLPFAVLTILYSVNDKIDQVMLERIYSRHEAGLYGAAYRWIDTIMMYLWTVLPIFFARFAFFIHSKKEQEKLLRFGQGIAAIPMIFCGIFALMYGEKLLWQFKASTPAEIETMAYCLRILFIAVMVNGVFAIYSTLLTSTGHERFVGWAIFGSISLNITLNAILIPQFGARACAWDTVISFSSLSIAYIVYIFKNGEISIPWDKLLKIALAGLACAGIFFGLDRAGMEWYWVSCISGAALLGLSWVLKIIEAGKVNE